MHAHTRSPRTRAHAHARQTGRDGRPQCDRAFIGAAGCQQGLSALLLQWGGNGAEYSCLRAPVL